MKCLLSVAICLCYFCSYSQVKFENVSLNEALSKALNSGKIVFAQFETETCEQCNDVANRAFENPELGKVVAERCIAIKIDRLSKDRTEFLRRFPSVAPMGTYFLLGNGELLHRYTSTTSLPSAYVNEINAAYNKWQEGMVTLNELDKEWNRNTDDVLTMEKYLNKRLALNLPTDSLLDIYVKRLPNDSIDSRRVLVFIATLAPIIGSEADHVLKRNTDLFKTTWNGLPLQQRININRRIIQKSLQKAINKKDEKFLDRIALFQFSTYENRNSEEAKKYNEDLYLSYYRYIKDYSKYLKLLVPYMDNYYMNHSVSSIRQQDSIRIKLLSRDIKGDTIRNTNGFAIRKVLQPYAPLAQFYSRPLNDAAWMVYTKAENKELLNKALQWAKRANELYSDAASMDTYARLLYKLGSQKEAIEWEAKAIELQKERKFNSKRFEEVLEKMNKGEQKIDEYSL